MSAVLGIDAAWTDRHDSGIALIARQQKSWHCIALAASYAEFEWLTDGDTKPQTRILDAGKVLKAASRMLAGKKVRIVAVDMPLSTSPIERRRPADDMISEKFGKFGCATHSPTAERPGPIADAMRIAFQQCHYLLQTKHAKPCPNRALIEVYPHPAILALCKCDYRVPYKVQNTARYWPNEPVASRRRKVVGEMTRILTALKGTIKGIPLNLAEGLETAPACELKAIEDKIDALVCAWVGIRYLNGKADCYGDASSAIWVPRRT